VVLRHMPFRPDTEEILRHTHVLDWWAWRAVMLVAVLGGGPAREKAWALIAERQRHATGAAVLRTITHDLDEARSGSWTAPRGIFGIPKPAMLDRKKLEDALRNLEASSWRVRSCATDVLGEAVGKGNADVVTGLLTRLSHASSRVRLAAIDLLSHVSDVLVLNMRDKVVQRLLETLSDNLSEMRSSAVATLTRLAARGGVHDQAVEKIVSCLVLGRTSGDVRHSMGNALVSIVETGSGWQASAQICWSERSKRAGL